MFAKKRICIATGGTGGHIFPSIALAQQLTASLSGGQEIEFLFLGAKLKSNRFLSSSPYPTEEVDAMPLLGKTPLALLKTFLYNLKGFYQAWLLLRKFQPDLLVAFGSYHTLPVLLAAKVLRLPYVLHEANSYPGKVNRLFAKAAKFTGVFFKEAASRLKGKTAVVDLPLRQQFLNPLSKEAARLFFNLDPNLFTFIVYGGSQGALALNLAVYQAITQFVSPRSPSFQLIHITGNEELTARFKQGYQNAHILAHVVSFEEQMQHALQASDFAIVRAGAGTIADLINMELPALFIPYPSASDNHQEHNADSLVNLGLGLKKREKELSPQDLSDLIFQLLAADRELLKKMAQAIQTYKKEKKAHLFSSLVSEQLGIKVR